MPQPKLTLREMNVAYWELFKEQLIRAVVGIFFVCILATCVGLYYGEDTMDDIMIFWKLEIYLSLFAIGLFLFKRLVFNRLVRKYSHET